MKISIKPTLIFLLLLSTFFLLPTTTFAVIKFGIDPNYNSEYFISGHHLKISAEPGDVIKDFVTVRNVGDEEVSIYVYPVDAYTMETGGFGIRLKDEPRVLFGKWTTMDEQYITLQPNEAKNLDFTFTVPDNITPGDYVGIFAAEQTDIKDPTLIPEEEQLQSGFKMVARVAFPAFINIPGEIEDKFVFHSFTKENLENSINFLINFSNEGNSMQRVSSSIEIDNLFHYKSFELPKLITDVLPNSKNVEHTNNWMSIPFLGGKFKAIATINYSRYNPSVQVDKDTEEYPEYTITEEMVFWIPPDKTFLISLVIIIILSLIGLTYSIIRKKLILKSLIKYKVKQGETLNSISKKYNCKWKLVAQINNITPPYEINTNQTLFIPTRYQKKKK